MYLDINCQLFLFSFFACRFDAQKFNCNNSLFLCRFEPWYKLACFDLALTLYIMYLTLCSDFVLGVNPQSPLTQPSDTDGHLLHISGLHRLKRLIQGSYC